MLSDDFIGLMKCYACGKAANMALHKRFRSVAHLHEKTAPGVFCSECTNLMKAGNTILISARPRTKEDEDPYRTGKICIMTRQGAERLFKNHDEIPPLAFIEDELWDRLGLPKGDEDYTDPKDAQPGWPSARCQKCGTWRTVRPTWADHKNHSTIQARCLTCQPDQSGEQQLFPHTLELYAEPHKETETATAETGNADPEKVSDPAQGEPQHLDPSQGHDSGVGVGRVESEKPPAGAPDPGGSGPGGVEHADGRG